MHETSEKRIRSTETMENPTQSLKDELFPQALRLRRVLPALLVAAAALVLIFFTNRTNGAFYHFARRFPAGYLAASTQFVSNFAIFAIVVLIWIQDRRRRAAVAVFLAALAISGSINGVIKTVAGRARPTWSVRLTDENKASLENYLKTHPRSGIHADGRDQWLWLSPGRPYGKYAAGDVNIDSDTFISFPSGHACTAFAMAAFLILMYPRASWLWLLIAAGTALARVAARRHFFEDVLFGGALGWIVAQWVFSWRWPVAVGRWLSERIRAR